MQQDIEFKDVYIAKNGKKFDSKRLCILYEWSYTHRTIIQIVASVFIVYFIVSIICISNIKLKVRAYEEKGIVEDAAMALVLDSYKRPGQQIVEYGWRTEYTEDLTPRSYNMILYYKDGTKTTLYHMTTDRWKALHLSDPPECN